MKLEKDTKKKMLNTFIQSVLAYIVVNIAVIDFNNEKEVVLNSLLALCVGAVASGLCALMHIDTDKEIEIDNEDKIDDEIGSEDIGDDVYEL